MYSYDGLFTLLKAKNMKRSELAAALGISSRTLAKIGRGERLADGVIARLCDFFGCAREELVAEVSNNTGLQAVREEKNANVSGGIYRGRSRCLSCLTLMPRLMLARVLMFMRRCGGMVCVM